MSMADEPPNLPQLKHWEVPGLEPHHKTEIITRTVKMTMTTAVCNNSPYLFSRKHREGFFRCLITQLNLHKPTCTSQLA